MVTVVPELRYTKNGMQQTVKGQPASFQGEKVMGNDQTISYLLGGHYTMKTAFPYEAAMQQSDLYLTFDAKVGDKVVKVPAVKVADGVIATSELYHQTVGFGTALCRLRMLSSVSRSRSRRRISNS